MRRYEIIRPAFSYHYDVRPAGSKDNAYYCRVKRFTKNTPDLRLYFGPDKTGIPVAMAHILQFSQSFKLGLGLTDTTWEDMIRSNIRGSEHNWGISINKKTEAGSETQRLELVWKRTTSVTTKGSIEPVTNHRGHRGHRGWKLVHAEEQDKILAVFTFDRVFGRRGVVEINVDNGQEFEHGVLMSILALYERSEER